MDVAVSQYEALRHALRARRRDIAEPGAIDSLASRWWRHAQQWRYGLQYWRRVVRAAQRCEAKVGAISDVQLDEDLAESRAAIARRQVDQQRLAATLALLSVLAQRQVGLKPSAMQLMAVLAIYHGQIAQVRPADGRFLCAALAGLMLAWSRPAVHIISSCAFGAERDCRRMFPLFHRAGITCDSVLPAQGEVERAARYRSRVVYVPARQLIADWLRDQVRFGSIRDAAAERLAPQAAAAAQVLVPALHAAVVDDADAVLIDDASAPVVASSGRSVEQSPQVYDRAAHLADRLAGQESAYEVDRPRRRVKLTPAGHDSLAELVQTSQETAATPAADDAVANAKGPWNAPRRRGELVEHAMAAALCYQKQQDYVIQEGRIIKIDASTGHMGHGPAWPIGMRQAIEAKEGLGITDDGRVLASVSFQRFFGHYQLLAGVSSPCRAVRRELERSYQVLVRRVLLRRVVRSRPAPLRWQRRMLFEKPQKHWEAVAESVASLNSQERPVIVGLASAKSAIRLGEMLHERGLSFRTIRGAAADDAETTAQAGDRGAITLVVYPVAAGLDIASGPGVAELGGPHLIICEHQPLARHDQRLIGRLARRGDPGSARIIVSLADPLLAKHSPVVVQWALRLYPTCPRWLHGPAAAMLFGSAQCRERRTMARSRKALIRRDHWLDQALPRQ